MSVERDSGEMAEKAENIDFLDGVSCCGFWEMRCVRVSFRMGSFLEEEEASSSSSSVSERRLRASVSSISKTSSYFCSGGSGSQFSLNMTERPSLTRPRIA